MEIKVKKKNINQIEMDFKNCDGIYKGILRKIKKKEVK